MDINDAIDEYLKKGFGSMNKNDFEVWIFHQLICGKYADKSNYEISIDLRISETKVKRLKDEANLKYGNNSSETYFNALEKVLEHACFVIDSKTIKFSIEDVSLRKYLDSLLKKNHAFSDTSFNKEIVTIDIDVFCVLIDEICPDDIKSMVLKKAKDSKGYKDDSFDKIIKKVIDGIATGLGGEISKTVINLSIYALMSLII